MHQQALSSPTGGGLFVFSVTQDRGVLPIVQSPTGGGPLGLVIYIINTSLFRPFQLYALITSFLSLISTLTNIYIIFSEVSQES